MLKWCTVWLQNLLLVVFNSFALKAQEVFFLHAVKVHEDRIESFEKIGLENELFYT